MAIKISNTTVIDDSRNITNIAAGTFTGPLSVTNSAGVLTRASATQDGIELLGRAGGTSDFKVSLTPTTLTASRTVTIPDASTTLVGTDISQTLTNKRISSRTFSTPSASSITPDLALYDMYIVTALAATLTINAPTGTPIDGDRIMFRILDNGTSRTLTWNSIYSTATFSGITLPTSTTESKATYVGCVYNSASTRWDVIAVATQA